MMRRTGFDAGLCLSGGPLFFGTVGLRALRFIRERRLSRRRVMLSKKLRFWKAIEEED